jgi:hypothetical protein
LIRRAALISILAIFCTGSALAQTGSILMPRPHHADSWIPPRAHPESACRSTPAVVPYSGLTKFDWFILSHWFQILFAFVPLGIAYARGVRNCRSYLWKCPLFGWILPGFLFLMWTSLRDPRSVKSTASAAKQTKDNDLKIHIVAED